MHTKERESIFLFRVMGCVPDNLAFDEVYKNLGDVRDILTFDDRCDS